jgi:hypothetical protein
MSYEITSADVTDGMNGAFAAGDVAAYIAIADTADDCMTAKGVPPVIGERLKVLYVQHMLVTATGSGGGVATSVSSASGASRSHASRKAGTSGFLDALKGLDQWGCVMALVRKPVLSVVFRGADL